MNEDLRKKCKELKVFQDVPYKDIATQLGLKKNSFYNWLRGYYNLSIEKQQELQNILSNFKGEF